MNDEARKEEDDEDDLYNEGEGSESKGESDGDEIDKYCVV